jgi:hypothetical protein
MSRTTLTAMAVALCAVAMGGCSLNQEFVDVTPALTSESSGDAAPVARQTGLRDDPGPIDATIANFLFTYAATEVYLAGQLTVISPGVATVLGKIVYGNFLSRLERPVVYLRGPGARASRRLDLSRGLFGAKFNGRTDSNTGRAELHGVAAIKFSGRGVGIACVKVDANFTQRGTKGTGTWRVLGGTGIAGLVRASGTLRQTSTVRRQGVDSDTGGAKAPRATLGRRRGLSPACKELAARFPSIS